MKNEEFAVSRIRDVMVVDRVGSGDAFSAGIIYSDIHGYTAGDAVEFASASSAFKHTVTKDINFSDVEEIKNIVSGCSGDVKR